MSNIKNAKYDWPTYLPKMVDLYKTGMSIPKIHAEIQDPDHGFTPSLSILYAKFRSENYSTEYTRSTLLNPTNTLTNPGNTVDHGYRSSKQVPTLPSTTNSYSLTNQNATYGHRAAGVDSYAPKNTASDIHQPASANAAVPSHQLSGFDTRQNPWNTTQFQEVQDSGPAATTSFHDSSWFDCDMTDFDDQFVLSDPWQAEIPYSTLNMQPLQTGPGISAVSQSVMRENSLPIDSVQEHNIAPTYRTSSEMETHREKQGVQNECSSDLQMANQKRQHETENEEPSAKSSLPSKRISGLATDSVAGRLISWVAPRRGFKRSVSPDNRLSGSPRDSGYASGRSSLMVPIPEDPTPHPHSLDEFKGLYRVPCQELHEPRSRKGYQESQTKDTYKNVPQCEHCMYSGVHNLSWSARHVRVAVFKAELKLDRLYNIYAIDAAGNSALHYAAVGGAGYEHFLALIEAGVNPYQINTLGQLFLHCLRPESDPAEDASAELFNINLVNLLNSLEPRGAMAALRWRDNEGRTVLDAVAAQMTSSDAKALTLMHVGNAGYPLEISKQFGYCQTRNRKSNFQQPSPSTDEEASPAPHENDFNANQERQDKAYTILGKASVEPSYVDPETGDNILHALSRLRLPERGSLLSKIHDFVAKDVDLNVHNRERDSPLAAFIRERPFLGVESDETGATMSKYLDALLWKDARRRIPNKINVNMKNREGVTALYYAAMRARPDSVRSLIEAGANVNARIDVDGQRISILQATRNAKAAAVLVENKLKIHLFDNVISYLEHDGAVADPTIMEERGVSASSVRIMPM